MRSTLETFVRTADDYIQVTFTLSEKVRDNIFRHPEALSVEDYYLRYHFPKDFKPPPGKHSIEDAVGNVNAYFMVRQTFEILNKVVRTRTGIIVKTIGDASMAALEWPHDAVSAGIEMVEELTRYNRTVSEPLSLKVGIHKVGRVVRNRGLPCGQPGLIRRPPVLGRAQGAFKVAR